MIHTVNLDLTTHCNRRCPECCAGVGINRTLQHHDWPYFERAANFLHGVERINLTGGEPTAHPQFEEFVPHFRELFGCKLLTMSTNGYRVVRYIATIARNIDYVHLSDYGDGAAALEALEAVGVKTWIFDAGKDSLNFIKRDQRGSQSCFRDCQKSGTVAYADGKLYGCCVAPGIETAQGHAPAANWRTWVETLPLPCGDCLFAEAV